MEEILFVGFGSIVEEVIQSAPFDVFTVITGTNGAVTKGAGLLFVLRAFFGAKFARLGA